MYTFPLGKFGLGQLRRKNTLALNQSFELSPQLGDTQDKPRVSQVFSFNLGSHSEGEAPFSPRLRYSVRGMSGVLAGISLLARNFF